MLLPCWDAPVLLFAWYLYLTAVQRRSKRRCSLGGVYELFGWQGTGCQESPAHGSQALSLGHGCCDTQWDRPLGEN